MLQSRSFPAFPLKATLAASAALLLAAGCSTTATMPGGPMSLSAAMVDNMSLPEPVRVPAGHKQTLWTVGAGEVTYECRAKANMADQYEWAFVAPVATLMDAGSKPVGKYYAGPTWEAQDGSKVTGKQVAVAPAAPGNIPLQLVKADPATSMGTGMGAMQNVAYIQRLNTQGGVPPATACSAANAGQRQQVAYRADYVFYARG
jgi:Protein of unknown function (DUF3455)